MFSGFGMRFKALRCAIFAALARSDGIKSIEYDSQIPTIVLGIPRI
jgi:hypothetical protein